MDDYSKARAAAAAGEAAGLGGNAFTSAPKAENGARYFRDMLDHARNIQSNAVNNYADNNLGVDEYDNVANKVNIANTHLGEGLKAHAGGDHYEALMRLDAAASNLHSAAKTLVKAHPESMPGNSSTAKAAVEGLYGLRDAYLPHIPESYIP
jgi:hypothetical protein